MRFNELQVRPPNRSRTGAESALRVNSKHEYRENCALKFGVCFRPDADVGTLMKRSFAARLASPTIRIRRRLHRSVQREVDCLFERHRTTFGPRPGEGSFVADSFLYCRDKPIEAGPLVWRRRRTDIRIGLCWSGAEEPLCDRPGERVAPHPLAHDWRQELDAPDTSRPIERLDQALIVR